MKRILVMVLRNIFIVPYYYFKAIYYGKSKKISAEKKYLFLKDIVKHANKGGNVIIESSGMENIPEEDGFIITPNHQGLYDVLAVVDSLGHPVSAVVKKELKNIPLLKRLIQVMGVHYMDREDTRQSMKVIIDVIKEVKEGTNYLIFPEGTRSKNGNVVGEFKAGTYKIATKSKCPILPVAMVDSFKPFDTNTISPVTMKICYLEPIYYEEYKDMNTTEIAEMVKGRIVDKMQEMMQSCE